MKIIVVSQHSNILAGGAERYVDEVCGRLKTRYGFSVRFVSADTSAGGVSRANLALFTSRFNFRWFFQLRRMFKEYRPDLVYLHYTVPGLSDAAFYAAKSRNIPCALMYHSDITGAGFLKKAVGHLYFRVLGYRMIQNCDLFFVTSRTYAANSPFLRKMKKPYVEAPPGLDRSILYPDDESDNNGEDGNTSETGVRAGAGPYILFAGKPELAEKGFHILKAAWQKLMEKGREFDLVVAGAAETGIEKAAHGKSCIRYLGKVRSRSRLYQLYGSAQMTVLPSLSSAESFGMVLAEALAAGSPVIGSRIGGIPEIVKDGINGYLVAPGDADSLATSLELAFKNNARLKKNISGSRHLLFQKYNWDRTADIVAGEMLRCVQTHN